MWDSSRQKFWAGTKADWDTLNKDVVPLDVQAWSILVLTAQNTPYLLALAYAEQHHMVTCLQSGQQSSGGVLAASRDELTTGFSLPYDPDAPWHYYKRWHVGATGWVEFALKQFNPLYPVYFRHGRESKVCMPSLASTFPCFDTLSDMDGRKVTAGHDGRAHQFVRFSVLDR